MIFSSIPFLYYFLPCVLLAYYLMPKAGRNGVLLLFSLLFYAWGEPRYLVVMLAATVLGYGFGLAMERFRFTACGGFSSNTLARTTEGRPWFRFYRLRN